jgi:hypothetical protein
MNDVAPSLMPKLWMMLEKQKLGHRLTGEQAQITLSFRCN